MKPLYIIGNWKSNKSIEEARDWIDQFQGVISNSTLSTDANLEVILCAAFIHLPILKEQFLSVHTQGFQLKLGAQNVSAFPDGAYTGEVSAHMLSGLVDYCLVGHSERRKYFAETDGIIANKVKQLQQQSIEPIVCVPDAQTPVPVKVKFIAYEPVWAIGSGKPATAEHANAVATVLKQKYPDARIIYGGSVTEENVASFVGQPMISGVLPGGASLEPESFYQIITHVINPS